MAFRTGGSRGDGIGRAAMMTDEPTRIYLFRSDRFAGGGGTVVDVASVALVVAAYGGGGLADQDGVQRAFGGSAFYRDDEGRASFIGVWGARNAARFRKALLRHAGLDVVHDPPPARLSWWTHATTRPSGLG